MFPRLRVALVVLSVLSPAAVHAAWLDNGNPVCIAANAQSEPTVVGDASGGAFVVWRDTRTGGGLGDVYVQHLDTNGNLAGGWPVNGIALESLATTILTPTAVSDGAGGAIAVWRDGRGGLYAQRVNGTGVAQWTANGVRVANVVTSNFSAIADGAGGVIVAWQDTRAGAANHDIYARRVNATGDTLWAPNGVPVCTFTGHQVLPTLASDGAGGAIVAWVDARLGSTTNRLYAQRVNSAGAVQWTANGVLAGGAGNVFNDQDLGACVDGAGGAFVIWTEFRNGQYAVYVQHLTSAGAPAAGWLIDGAGMNLGVVDAEPTIVSDGAGGCVMAGAVFGSLMTRVAHVNGAGTGAWTQDFFMLNGTDGPALAADGAGGAAVVYLSAFNLELVAGKVLADGSVPGPWTNDGFPICSESGARTQVRIASAGADAIAAWTDSRNSGTTGNDIYAVKLGAANPTGVAPPIATQALAITAHPNPVRGALTARFALHDHAPATLAVVDLAGRIRATREVGALGAGAHSLALAETRALEPGVYFLRLACAGAIQSLRFAVVR